MNAKKHLILLIVTLVVWTGFYVLGLSSNYFVEWKFSEKVLLSLITFFAVVPFIGFTTIILLSGDYFKTSLWFAFYASVLIFMLDLMIVAFIENKGFSFIYTHWPQTTGYIYVWIELPVIGLVIKRIVPDKALT